MNVVDMAGRLELPLFNTCGTYSFADFLEVREGTLTVLEVF